MRSDLEIDNTELKINESIKALNNTLNHENFRDFVQNGYFSNNENTNLKDTPE